MNFTLWQFTKRVFEANRVIQAVSKHVIAQNTLAGGCVGVGINKPAYLGIVITGLEVVELGLGVVYVAAIAQGVHICQGARLGYDITVGIVFVFRQCLTVSIDNV